MKYLEVAIESPRKRGLLLSMTDYESHLQEFYKKGKNIAIYRSHYLYGDDAMDWVNNKNSIKSFMGDRYVDNILIDIDKKDDSNERVLEKTKLLDMELKDLSLKDGNYEIFYSGTGYHVLLSADNFGFTPSPDLPYIVKQTLTQMITSINIDPSVYTRTAIYREEGTMNQKSGLFKVKLPFKDFQLLDYNDVLKLSKENKKPDRTSMMWGDESLSSYIKETVAAVRQFKAVAEPYKVVPCVQQMWSEGPQEGSRNNIILRIASHFRRNGIPSDATKASLLHWNSNFLDEKVVLEKVEAVYNAGYQYSCQDPYMKERCKTQCIFYKRKDYQIDVKDFNALQQNLENRLSTDYSGRTIDLSRIFGMPQLDCEVYPGEMVTIFGPTGSGKTTLAQNIVCGYNASQNEIDPDLQLNTLYLSLELSDWYMHKRHIQIVADVGKEEIEANVAKLGKHYRSLLRHIIIQTIPPTIEQIQQKIRDLQPQVVVVDYIDLIDAGPRFRGEYESIRHISHSLSNMAVQSDIIIIQLSQVSRDYSRNDVLDLYAGKGSGAIENASRKVLGLKGQAKDTIKYLSLFKNSDGELFDDIPLEWQPSFRLRRTYE